MTTIKENWKPVISPVINPSAIKEVQLIHTGGSDRAFYRLKTEGSSYILQETKNLEEFNDYISIGSFFYNNNIVVPKILSVDNEKGIALFQDAGETDLQKIASELLKKESYEEPLSLYKKVLDKLIEIQAIENAALPHSITKRKFDFDYYRWETDYFLENCVGVYFNFQDYSQEDIAKELDELAKSLGNEPEVTVHRDFQSQNIYLKDNGIYFLDFQSARLGSMFYDVASLLKDPYMELPGELHDILLEYYLSEIETNNLRKINPNIKDTYNRVAVQRLMQALGAYGNLGINKGKSAFLKYIPPALRLLKSCINSVEGYPSIKKLVCSLGKL